MGPCAHRRTPAAMSRCLVWLGLVEVRVWAAGVLPAAPGGGPGRRVRLVRGHPGPHARRAAGVPPLPAGPVRDPSAAARPAGARPVAGRGDPSPPDVPSPPAPGPHVPRVAGGTAAGTTTTVATTAGAITAPGIVDAGAVAPECWWR